MKNIYFSLFLLMAVSFSANAETWNGSTSTDWNTASNWAPATVPSATSTVTIPTFGITNYPQLSSNITIERISMSSGAKLDVNGFSVTVLGGAGNNIFNNDTISNSAVGTTIVFNMAAGSGYSSRIMNSVFTDTVVFNITGTASFYEGYNSSPNTFNHSVTYNVNDSLDFYTSYISGTIYLEDVTVNRSVVGQSFVLQHGGSIAGDFSYTNNVGGETRIGGAGASQLSTINGQVNIQSTDATTSSFLLRGISNLTTGGTINIQGSKGFVVQSDTLLVSAISILDYTGGAYGHFRYNDITGNVNISPDTSYSSGYYTIVRGNVITGTTTISNPCSNALYETFTASGGNVFNGNTIVNANGTGRVELGYAAPSTYNGNLTVDRTVGGITAIFKNGGTVSGDFNYTNNTTGSSDLGNLSNPTLINGNINIYMPLSTPGRFRLYNIKNQTGSGGISTFNTLGADIRSDTLMVNFMNIANYTGSAYAYLWDNHITGDISMSSDSTYVGGYSTQIRRNNIIGNSQFTINSSNALNESNSLNASNIFTGNTNFTANGSGEIRLGWNDTSTYNGDVTITRTAAGTTTVFGSGAFVNGNFSYINSAGGSTSLGYANYPTLITGTIDMDVDYPSPAVFNVLDFTNLTTGGTIDVRGTQGYNFRDDSLKVTSLSLTEYTGSAYGRFYRNEIMGDVTISDDTSYVGGYYTDLQDNTINGNMVGTLNSSNNYYSDYGGNIGNVYNGNTIFNANGSGTLRVSGWNGSTFNGDLTINRTQNGQTRVFENGGVVNGNVAINNLATGDVYLGTLSDSTWISGILDITVNDTVPEVFRMRRIINNTTGGAINIQGTQAGEISNDTLKVTSLSMIDFRGNDYALIRDNKIEGDVTIRPDSSYVGGYYTSLRSNKFIGNTTIINDGTNFIYDADATDNGNEYIGNLYLTEGQGDIRIGNNDTSSVSGDLILNSTSGIELRAVRFNGTTNAVINQLGTQAIQIDDLIMEKTGADLTLNKPVNVNDGALFIGGRILSTATNKLTFENNATASVLLLSSHVDGMVSKIGDDTFTFPIGKNGKYAPIGISAPTNTADEFTAEYFEAMPHTSGYDSSMKDAGIDHISQNEYWICDRTAGTSNVAVTLSWYTTRSGGVNNLGDLLVCRWDGTTWKDHGQTAATGSFSSGTVTSNTVTSFSPFTLGSSTANNPLPITLLSFDVKKQGSVALLNWATESEIDFDHFDIERSADGIHFEKINVVEANGQGGITNYEIIDERPLEATNYYRLRMVDHNEGFTFSEIRTVNFSTTLQATLYPNPTKNIVYFNSENYVKGIEVLELSGRLIDKLDANNITEYDMTSLKKGIYFIRLFQGDDVQTFRVIRE